MEGGRSRYMYGVLGKRWSPAYLSRKGRLRIMEGKACARRRGKWDVPTAISRLSMHKVHVIMIVAFPGWGDFSSLGWVPRSPT